MDKSHAAVAGVVGLVCYFWGVRNGAASMATHPYFIGFLCFCERMKIDDEVKKDFGNISTENPVKSLEEAQWMFSEFWGRVDELYSTGLEENERKWFKEGWRKCEEKMGQPNPDRVKLAEYLKVDVNEKDKAVWDRARKQFMFANHPDRNHYADPARTAEVNALFDVVFN